MTPVLALTMSVMSLNIVVSPPRLMGLLDFWPSARIGERMVGKPPLDREQGLSVIFPRLARIDAFFADAKHVIELESLRAAKLLDILIVSLREKHLLLFLDNFEHVVTAAPKLSDLLTVCPRLKILVTSRAPLHISGEHEDIHPNRKAGRFLPLREKRA